MQVQSSYVSTILTELFPISRQEAHPGDVKCVVGEEWWTSSVVWVAMLLQESSSIGQPITSFIFRPTGPDGKTYRNIAMESTALNNRLKVHLKAHNLTSGPTIHGIRRGRLQHDHANGSSVEELMATALTSTASIMTGRYLNTQAHL